MRRWGPNGLFGAALAACVGAISLHPIHESDAYWHMMLGRSVLAAGSREVPEPAAFASFSPMVIVPEWLWDVFTYALYQGTGPVGLSVCVGVLSAGCAVAVCWMLSVWCRDSRPSAFALVTTLILVVLTARLRLRPQLAFLILLPTFIGLTLLYLRAEGKHRLRLAAALVLHGLFWAQLHGSFVIAPAVFGLVALPDVRRDWSTPRRSLHLFVSLGLLLAFISSADGAWVVGYVLAHAAGDAARHVGDMKPPLWEDINPTNSPIGAATLLLIAVALVGMGVAKRVRATSLMLALFGLMLALNSVRFVAVAALLLGPMALEGANAMAKALPRPRVQAFATGALCLALLAWAGLIVHGLYGPMGRLGMAVGRHPMAAIEFMRGLAPGTSVLTSFDSGSAIGFELSGRIRTYVDTRTPIHFDDTDYAVAREVWQRPGSLALALRRYRAEALVTERLGATCGAVPAGWVPVVVESRFTTFVPSSGTWQGEEQRSIPRLRALAPCGAEYFTSRVCEGGGALLDEEIARLARFDRSGFVDYLRAERILRCGGDVAQARALLPERHEAWQYRKQRALALSQASFAQGDALEATEGIRGAAEGGDLDALGIVMHSLAAGGTTPWAARRMLESGLRAHDDETPVALRADLADVCMRLGDAECVRFHGTRAAIAGSPKGPMLLSWLRLEHPDPRVRADAEEWLRVLPRGGGLR